MGFDKEIFTYIFSTIEETFEMLGIIILNYGILEFIISKKLNKSLI